MHTESREAQARAIVDRAGYARGGEVGDEKQDRRMVRSAVHQHESHDHPGKPETKLKLRGGGKVSGQPSAQRPDRRARGGGIDGEMPGMAKGGSTHGKRKPVVNIKINAGGDAGGKQQAAQDGMRLGAALGARRAAAQIGAAGPAHPAMPMPPPGAIPPGVPMAPPGAAGMRPPGIKRGGAVKRANGGSVEASMRQPGVVQGGKEAPHRAERLAC